MHRRRQRRLLPAQPPPDRPSQPPARTRARSWTRACSAPLLRRVSRSAQATADERDWRQGVESETEGCEREQYLAVRVLDFVTVPPVRLGEPGPALGPVDAMRRPPSYDLRGTQWSGEEVDRCLDDESEMEEEKNRVFVIDDQGYAEKLVEIVQRAENGDARDAEGEQGVDETEQREVGDEEEEGSEPDYEQEQEQSKEQSQQDLADASSEGGEDDEQRGGGGWEDGPEYGRRIRLLVNSIDDHASDATSSTLSSEGLTRVSVTSTAGLSAPPSTASSTFIRTPSPPAAEAAVAKPAPRPRRRTCLLSTNVPSPVRYTFRPPVKPALEHAPMLHLRDRTEAAKAGHAGARAACGAEKGSPRRRSSATSATSSGTASIEPAVLGAVQQVVDAVDLRALSGRFRWVKRDSDESARSTETEYYEDEYTKFIEKKAGSPLRLRPHAHSWGRAGVVGGGGRLYCRSNSTMSVATSDEEYRPFLIEERYSHV